MKPPADWSHLSFFSEDWPTIHDRLESAGEWLPGPERLFKALEILPPREVRVVILGQDPYPTSGHANGLAFSVTRQTPIPRSLRNIFAELKDDIGKTPMDGDLTHWAQQGVLLLNTSLSVPAGQAGGHARWGWQKLAQQAIHEAQSHSALAFLLWGGHAQKAVGDLPRSEDLTIATAHPSPLSARRGFFGSRPFSRINNWLIAQGSDPIDWIG